MLASDASRGDDEIHRGPRRSLIGGVVLAVLICLLSPLDAALSATEHGTPRLASTTFTSVKWGSMTPFRGDTYFFADDGIHGRELWRTDGTASGTVLFADLTPGDDGSDTVFDVAGDGTGEMVATDHRLYFVTGGSSPVVWYTDGSHAPVQAGALPYFRSGMVVEHDRVQVVGCDALYRVEDSDTTVRSFGTKTCYFNVGAQGAVLGHYVYYAAQTSGSALSDYELWRSDLTGGGTELVKDIRTGTEGSMPLGLVATSNRVYFFADDGTHGQELYVSDGTASGTERLTDLGPGDADINVGDYRAVGRTLWLSATEQGAVHNTVWHTTGGPLQKAGTMTRSYLALMPGTFGSHVAVSQDGELRTTAGSGGLPKLSDHYLGSTATVGDELYFPAFTSDSVSTAALYRSGGTRESTVAVRTFDYLDRPRFVGAAGGRVFYFTWPSSSPGYRMGFYRPGRVRATVRVTLQPARVVVPSGKRPSAKIVVHGLADSVVVLKDGKHKIRTLHLKGHRATVKLPKHLRPGRHVVRATLRPTAMTTGAKDSAVLQVVRR